MVPIRLLSRLPPVRVRHIQDMMSVLRSLAVFHQIVKRRHPSRIASKTLDNMEFAPWLLGFLRLVWPIPRVDLLDFCNEQLKRELM